MMEDLLLQHSTLYKLYRTWDELSADLLDLCSGLIVVDHDHFMVAQTDDKPKLPKTPVICNWIATHLIDEHAWFSIGTTLYAYMGNCYAEVSRTQLHDLIRKIWISYRGDFVANSTKEVYKSLCGIKTFDPLKIDKFVDCEPYLLPFRNVIVDLRTGEQINHSPAYIFTKIIDMDYLPTATCPRFHQNMVLMFPDLKIRQRLLHFLSYGLSGSIELQMGQIWVGKGGTGKTTFQIEYMKCLGEYARKIKLNVLFSDKHQREQARARRMIWGSEVGGCRMNKETVNNAKEFLTDGLMDGERKFCSPIEFVNTSKCCYATNDTPVILDSDDFFYERWDFIPFTVRFRGLVGENKNFWGELFAEEKEGIFAYLVSLFPKIKEILTTPIAVESRKMWNSYSSHTMEFLSEMCTIAADKKTPRSDLYNYYVGWCETKDKKPYASETFVEYMQQLGHPIISCMSVGNNPKFMHHFQGVEIGLQSEEKKDDYNDSQKDQSKADKRTVLSILKGNKNNYNCSFQWAELIQDISTINTMELDRIQKALVILQAEGCIYETTTPGQFLLSYGKDPTNY